MVRVYALNIENMPDPKEKIAILDQLSNRRKEKVLRCSQLKGRKEAAGAGLLLKKIFEKYGVSEEAITYGENGKPEMDGFYFNLSHSGNVVICAVSEKEVGCDIEKTEKCNEKIAKRFFTERENVYLNRTFEGNEDMHFEQFSESKTEEGSNMESLKKDRDFFRIWTMKESYIKMTGEGMKVPLLSVEAALWEEPIRIWRDGMEENCFIKEYEIEEYRISVCARESDFTDEVWMFSYREMF